VFRFGKTCRKQNKQSSRINLIAAFWIIPQCTQLHKE
jgi:hypothetical protein